MPRRYDREDAKRRILSVCVKLFIERGYEKTTTAEILEKADVTNGTFYNIFSTKERRADRADKLCIRTSV